MPINHKIELLNLLKMFVITAMHKITQFSRVLLISGQRSSFMLVFKFLETLIHEKIVINCALNPKE
jgi:hypothetical protein